VIAHADFRPAVNVPGIDYKTLLDSPVRFVESSSFEGRYDGIVMVAGGQSLAKWTTCCTAPTS
jgi:hypothetical protein